MKKSLLSRMFVGLFAALMVVTPVMTMTVATQTQAHEIVKLQTIRQTVWQVKRDTGTASAVIVSPGLAVTAGHVAEGTDRVILIHPVTGDEYPCWVVKMLYDESNDMALLKPVFGIFPSPYAPLREDIPTQDEVVVAVGYPLQEQIDALQIATYGTYQGVYKENYGIITAPITFGNSGGGAFDAQGRLVGITVAAAGASRFGPVGHINYIIRSDVLLEYILTK